MLRIDTLHAPIFPFAGDETDKMEIRLSLLGSNGDSALSCALAGLVSLFEEIRGF